MAKSIKKQPKISSEDGKKMAAKKDSHIVNPDAAGIDVASREHWVCVPIDRSKGNVKKFGTFTSDLNDIANWLKECRNSYRSNGIHGRLLDPFISNT